MQRELGAQLDSDGFAHYAFYNVSIGRMEMHLISLSQQTIRLSGEAFHFGASDSIHTEDSYKYSTQEFQKLARAAGWHPKMSWSDHDGLFSVHCLSLTARKPHHLPQHVLIE